MVRYPVLVVLILIFICSRAESRTITDMTGRKVTIPDRIEKAVALSPPATYMLYSIDPALVSGLNFPLQGDEKIYTVERFKKIPVFGGMVGESRTLNLEVLLKIKPDVAFIWERSAGDASAINREYERVLKPLGIPAVFVRMDLLSEYPPAIQFMGDVLGRKERTAKLNRYALGVMHKVARTMSGIPPGKKISVYYAEGLDGLASEGEGSMHTELIPLSGGTNVCRFKSASAMGLEKITMEQLLLYDPDVILVKEKICFERIQKDVRWKQVRAVRNKRIYLIPHVPFNWFDRPPSQMRLLGIQWLTNLLHPDLYPIDMVKETKSFYRLFVGRTLSDGEAKDILRPR